MHGNHRSTLHEVGAVANEALGQRWIGNKEILQATAVGHRLGHSLLRRAEPPRAIEDPHDWETTMARFAKATLDGVEVRQKHEESPLKRAPSSLRQSFYERAKPWCGCDDLLLREIQETRQQITSYHTTSAQTRRAWQ